MLSVLCFLLSLSYFVWVTRTTGFCGTRSRALQSRRGATDWFRRLRSTADWLRSRAGFLRATLPLLSPQSRRSEAPQSECKRDRQHSPCDKFGRKVHIVSYIAECLLIMCDGPGPQNVAQSTKGNRYDVVPPSQSIFPSVRRLLGLGLRLCPLSQQ